MTILVAEDYEANRKLLKAIFSHEGFRVFEAANGAEALEILEREPIDAVISDILMPNMDGYRFCASVRRSGRHPDVPFIFYTSTYTSPSDEKLGLEVGADRFIRKPAAASELVRAVRELVAAPVAEHQRDVSLPEELDLSKKFTEHLVAKLEEKNDELHLRTRELRETSDTLQALIRAAPVAIISFDHEAKVTTWNPAAERIFGWSEAEVVSQRPPYLRLEDEEEFEELRHRVLAGETITGIERQHRRRDGTAIEVELSGAPLHDADGKIVGKMAVLADITDRKRAQEALRQSEQRFAAFMHHLPGFAWMKDLEGRYVYLNKAMQKVRAYQTAWLGRTDAELWPPEIAAEYMANDRKVIAERRAILTIQPYLADGKEHHVIVSKFPILDETGAIVLVGGASVDITERIEAERALRESEERFRQLAENIDEVFWIANTEFTEISYISPAYERIWGHTCESLYKSPRSWMESIHAEDKEKLLAALASRGLAAYELTYRIMRPDGSIRWIRDRGFPVRDESGNVVRFAGIAEDVTGSKQIERQLEHFAELFQALSHRLFDIQEEERRHLARELHDEIGQALTAAKLNLKIIAPEASPAVAGRLDDSVQIIDRLLNQVRQLSLDLRPPLLDELGLVPALRWLADQQAQRTGLHITFTANLENLEIEGTVRIACFRLAQEAITNAIRHAGAQAIELALRHEADRLWLSVRDDGAGFDSAAIQQQAKSGASLGLLSMKERALLAGGDFEVTSTPGRGTEIRAWFPLQLSGLQA